MPDSKGIKSPPLPRFTKVIFTIGPATVDVGVLRRMIRKGVDVCRINMAHASHEWTQKAVAAVREASEAEGAGVALLMDMRWGYDPLAVLSTIVLCLAVTLAIGFAGTWRALGQKAAPLLRNE